MCSGRRYTRANREKENMYIRGNSALLTEIKLKSSWLLEYLQKDKLTIGRRKLTRGSRLTCGGTEGPIRVRREWFDALSKGMVDAK